MKVLKGPHYRLCSHTAVQTSPKSNAVFLDSVLLYLPQSLTMLSVGLLQLRDIPPTTNLYTCDTVDCLLGLIPNACCCSVYRLDEDQIWYTEYNNLCMYKSSATP